MKYLVRKAKSKKPKVSHIWDESHSNTLCKIANSKHFKPEKYKITEYKGRGGVCKVCQSNLEKGSPIKDSIPTKAFRKQLKANPTPYELKAKEILDHFGVKYKFQKGFYSHDFSCIVDFFIPSGRFVIEIDGGYHENQASKDAWRDKKLTEKRGCTVIRIKNEDVHNEYLRDIIIKYNIPFKSTELVEITEDFMREGMSDRGAWNKKQTKALGIDKLTKGWKKRLIGTKIPIDKAKLFLQLKNSHLK